jgi:4-hydroxy-3-methylbut-2-en-1-yl diphosphate reductase
MNIEIDNHSGFCYGVVKTIQLAENALEEGNPVYCLGDIVHNEKEVERLKSKGLVIIDHQDLKKISNFTVLIRAHGEPPDTYRLIEANANILKEGTCPIVLHLQKRIQKAWEEMKMTNGQIVIFGKKGHAEVIGLVGQTEDTAIIVNNEADLEKIDFSRPIALFAQTTQSMDGYESIGNIIRQRMSPYFQSGQLPLTINDSICRHVSKRGTHIMEFAERHDVIVFVSGTSSSNGKVLYELCKKTNPKSYKIADTNELKQEWFANAESVGICSATSTPMWLMEEAAETIKQLSSK